jgi:hypothetical protein
VISPDGATTYYGNNNADDEVNNVEQVAIPVPVTGVYTVVVTSHTFTESDTQAVSVVITSPGVVSSRSEGTVQSADNQLSCGVGYSMITLTLMDRGGDGWGTGNSYAIYDSTGLVVQSGTMTSAIPGDVLSYESFCLQHSVFSVRLIQNGENSDEMGLEIDSCAVYLSEFNRDGVLNIGVTGCNTCSGFEMDVVLVGSLYGVPYGWAQGSVYTVSGSNVNYGTGTLVTGVFNTHTVCVTPGALSATTYTLLLSGVPSTDDQTAFFDDDYMANLFGVEGKELHIMPRRVWAFI